MSETDLHLKCVLQKPVENKQRSILYGNSQADGGKYVFNLAQAWIALRWEDQYF